MEFNILKKNRKYFAATKGGYKCKILIDDNSQALELGAVDIDVEDISVRTKYGTDLIFKLTADAETQAAAGICTLQHYTYNKLLVEQCHKLGGKWDAESKAWIFKDFVADKVEELDYLYNSELTNYQIEFEDDYSEHNAPVYLFGVKVAEATGRDSGATLGNDVALIAGRVDSGGSMKNWGTKIKEGTILRLSLPTLLVEELQESECENKDFTIKAI